MKFCKAAFYRNYKKGFSPRLRWLIDPHTIFKNVGRANYWSSVGRREEVSELIILDLTGTVLVNILNKLLDVDGHFELVLNYIYESLSIDSSITIFLSTHCHEGIKSVFFIASRLVLFLFCYNMPKLGVRDFPCALCISFCNHSENLLLRGLLSHHL